ncbi:MAG: hypothetical protein KJ905_02250 [Nanoarchaeota archaeon]|nr:hypothetical protein [Nanoarchaeota archaeon]MBU1501573.1 hypothetical protein [Nanoarchaeota archaeon]MBU2459246.1 hypothetical protein [Nanoarchaeota archaeon]
MVWYNYFIYATIIIGLFIMLFGVHHIKYFRRGLILIISALIIKVFIWILMT